MYFYRFSFSLMLSTTVALSLIVDPLFAMDDGWTEQGSKKTKGKRGGSSSSTTSASFGRPAASGRSSFSSHTSSSTHTSTSSRTSSSGTSHQRIPAVDFDKPYPEAWNRLSLNEFFLLLQDNERPTPQDMVDWCNGLLSIFKEKSLQKDRKPIFISRSLTLLGQKAKTNKTLKTTLQRYFGEKPVLMKRWQEEAIAFLSSKKPNTQFNQQHLSNIFYGYGLLGLQPEGVFYDAWREATLARLQSGDPRTQFDQQELSNIFYGHAQLGLQPEDAFLKVWLEAAKPAFKESQFSKEALHSIYLFMKRFSLEDAFKDEILSGRFSSMKEDEETISPRGSSFQNDVLKSLQGFLKGKGLGEEVESEVWFDSLASRVDGYIRSLKIVVEADGPFHFFPGTQTYKPNDALREAILLTDPEVKGLVRVPYFEWNDKKDKEKNDFWQIKLSSFLKAEGDEEQKQSVKKGTLNVRAKEFISPRLNPLAAPFVPKSDEDLELT